MIDGSGYGKKFEGHLEKEFAALEVEFITAVKNGEPIGRVDAIRKFREAGKRSFGVGTNGGYKEAYNESKKLFESVGVPWVKLTEADLEVLRGVKLFALEEIVKNARTDGAQLWQELNNFTVTGKTKGIEDAVISHLKGSKLKQYGNTVVNTSIDTFYRTTSAVKGARAGVEKWRYMGPPPDREFCNSLFRGKRVYTTDEINAMSNGQGLSVFFSGGGWNCRHYWAPEPES